MTNQALVDALNRNTTALEKVAAAIGRVLVFRVKQTDSTTPRTMKPDEEPGGPALARYNEKHRDGGTLEERKAMAARAREATRAIAEANKKLAQPEPVTVRVEGRGPDKEARHDAFAKKAALTANESRAAIRSYPGTDKLRKETAARVSVLKDDAPVARDMTRGPRARATFDRMIAALDKQRGHSMTPAELKVLSKCDEYIWPQVRLLLQAHPRVRRTGGTKDSRYRTLEIPKG